MPTLFIDSLPQGYSSYELRKLFPNHGYIADVYVPRIQRSRVNGRFGFIEVQAWEHGERLIHDIDGMEVGSMKIKVNWAKYPKRLGQSKRPGRSGRGDELFRNSKNWGSSKQPTRVQTNDKVAKPENSAKVIKVEEVQENLDWLERSLTCFSDVPRDIESLRLMINNAFHEKIVVRDLGKFKFLLTMDSKETKDRLKIDGEKRLKQWFSTFDDWDESDVCQTRRIWLEMVGLPMQLWSEKNIRRIAESWGDVVLVEEESSKLESFASAKVIIDTLSVSPIEGEAIIQVKDKGFTVSVFEAKTEFTIFHTGPMEEDSSGPSISKGNGKLDVMNFDGHMVDQVNLDHGDRQEKHSNGDVEGGRDEDQAQTGCCDLNLNLNSNFTQHVDQPRGYHNEAIETMIMVDDNRDGCEDSMNAGRIEGLLVKSPLITMGAGAEGVTGLLGGRRVSNVEISCSSSTKTKTAQLSGNDYDMEMEKIHHLRNEQLRVNQGAGLEDEVNQSVFSPVQLESDVSTPPGFGVDKGSAPSRFEGSAAPKVTTGGKDKASSRRRGPVVGNRVTRSQTTKATMQARRSQSIMARTHSRRKCAEVSPVDRQSIETTESMKQLAEEALKIGELLGVKVISHKANAVKGITDSLKSNRDTRSMRAR